MPYVNVTEPDNIWAKNPQLKSLKHTRKLFEESGEEWFNRVYYAIYLVNDPLSPYRATEDNLKSLRATVKKDYFEDPEDNKKFNWMELRPVIGEFNKQKTKEEKLLERLEKKLEEAQKLMDDFVPEHISQLTDQNKALAAMEEMWNRYLTVKKECQASNSSNSGGGYGGTHSNIFSS